MTFNGKAVIVTGGGTGIGRATARSFAERGARVLVVGRTAARLAETAEGLPGIHPLALDIADPDAPGTIVDTAVREFGRLDVLVNNAGVVRHGYDRDAVMDMVTTNLLAPSHLAEAARPHLAESKGVIVNVSTSIGQRGWPMPGGALYAALKSALESLTRSWAVQFAPDVRVVAVAPGPIATPIGLHQGLTPEQNTAVQEALVAHVPLKRIGRPEEVAFWITRLASPEAAFTTGVVLPVDGGAVVA
ncbi:SDR family oxidoreductase [Saccharothrix sp.]|uniref:SDR family NAD(P)-dependent oxidoreductase n=1 Tax=Saccharothrix sp. TaxID=1873460 RepID=UPI0028120D75|nr:SDR family oxidoreductase [Saccharothrix sp.]